MRIVKIIGIVSQPGKDKAKSKPGASKQEAKTKEKASQEQANKEPKQKKKQVNQSGRVATAPNK